jgi:hypothetical protein
MTYPEQAGQKFEMPCSLLSASRTKDCTENDKHDCHSYQEAEVILAPVVVDFVDLTTLVDEGEHQGHRGNDPVPQSQRGTGDTTVRVGCIEEWIGARRIDLYAHAGNVDLIVGGGSTGLSVWGRRVDLCDSAGSTARDYYKRYSQYDKYGLRPFHLSAPVLNGQGSCARGASYETLCSSFVILHSIFRGAIQRQGNIDLHKVGET